MKKTLMPMRRKRSIAFLFLSFFAFCFAFILAALPLPAQTPDLGHFPNVHATSLQNARMSLPHDFAGQLNLVIVSFAREQQKAVDTWLPAARQIQSTHSKFSYYELSTMSRENLLYRWWFDAALRSDTSEKDLRARILTTYLNKHKFRNALRISNEKRIVALLVDKTGRVYWRADGRCTDEAKRSLQSALTASGL